MTLKAKIQEARKRVQECADVFPQPERNYWLGYMSGLNNRLKSKRTPKNLHPFSPVVLNAQFDRGVWDGWHIDAEVLEVEYGPDMMLTIDEFVEHYGKQAGRNNAAYMRFCCQGKMMANGHRCKMPEGWRAKKIGTAWMITPDPSAFQETTKA